MPVPLPDHFGWYAPWRVSRRGMALVVAAHALVFLGLLRMQAIALPALPAVLSVSLLPVAEVREPPPEIAPPRPQPQSVTRRQAPVQPPPQFAAPIEAPAPATVAAIPPQFDADYLDNPKPPYPALSRRIGEQGRVVLRVRVDAGGLPRDIQLHTGSGSVRLDHAALDTVHRWKFVPARLGNDAVAATVLVPITFSLKD